MKKFISRLLLCASLTPIVWACSDADPIAPRQDGSLLVINEGNFTEGNGSMDLLLPDGGYEANIFEQANQQPTGGILQDFQAMPGREGVIITNNPDQVLLTKPDTLLLSNRLQLPELVNPRFSAWYGSMLYVTNWGPYEADYSLLNSSLLVIDPAAGKVINEIALPSGPEGILATEEALWIANNFTDTLSIYYPATQQLQKMKSLPNPLHLLQDASGLIWVSFASGYLAAYDPVTKEEIHRVELIGQVPAGKLLLHANSLYYRSSSYDANWNVLGAVYRLPISEAQTAPSLYFSQQENLYCFALDEKGRLLLGFAAGAEPGLVIRYATDGQEEMRWPVGVFPSQIHLN